MDSKYHRSHTDPNRNFLDITRHQHRTRWRHGGTKPMACHRLGRRNRGYRAADICESVSGQRLLIKTKSLQSLLAPDNRDQGE